MTQRGMFYVYLVGVVGLLVCFSLIGVMGL
ncbi:hypothetical protein FHS29_006868 [Saccharothrix tamanrassetensis]|uniref:Uncharacterized protein n=1 Tax=Saccharothrix tamanrassetensis TaxID=1051531 RepID=A0A841CWB1_9PSEU|nr:hypothetical protein [Saccharothrix tamanrassetensis]